MRLFYDIVIYFILFGFCGWVCECVFCSINEKKVVNRGFLSGPICPVYGFGGLIVIYILSPMRGNAVGLFIWGMCATTLLEYITSWVLEKLFNTQWWNYDDLPFNINGRVCLRFSVVFGMLSVVAAELLYPPFSAVLRWIPQWLKPYMAWGMLALLLADCAVTVHGILQLNGKLAEMHRVMAELRAKLESVQDSDGMTFAQRVEQYKEERDGKYAAIRHSVENGLDRLEKLHHRSRFQQRRLFAAFPSMRSTKYQEQMAKLKESLGEIKNKAKKLRKTP